jgi:hypothetical protein
VFVKLPNVPPFYGIMRAKTHFDDNWDLYSSIVSAIGAVYCLGQAIKYKRELAHAEKYVAYLDENTLDLPNRDVLDEVADGRVLLIKQVDGWRYFRTQDQDFWAPEEETGVVDD